MMRAGPTRSIAVGAILVALGVLPHTACGAEPEVTAVHSGNTAGLGRIVVDAGGTATFKLDRNGNHVVVRFDGPIKLDRAPLPPRNVISIATEGPAIELIVVPGASIHPAIVSGHIVFNILDPPAAMPAQTGEAPRGGATKPVRPSPVNLAMARSPELGGRAATHPAPLPGPPTNEAESAVKPLQATPAATPAAPRTVTAQPLASLAGPADASDKPALEAMQPTPPGRDVKPESAAPLGLLARRTKLPKGLEGSAFLVPFGNTTGAAVFQSGGRTFVVFDERRPVDMSVLHADPVFGQTTVQLLPNGTLLRLPVPAGVSIALFQTPQGWRIAGLAAAAKTQPIAATYADGAISLGAEQPSDVISMADPDTGATLLVGTQRRPGQGVATTRHTAQFILRATGLGVVVEPLSDAIMLKVIPTGFMLSGGGDLAVSPATAATEALMQAAHLTRRLNFSPMAAAPLMRLMSRQIADAAAAQPQARGPKRQAIAQSMMALGMAAEAESLLDVAAEQDPRQAASADATALKAIAALLAGRPADADGINDPRLTGTDDIALWRAVRQAMLDAGSPSAAAVFASTAPLALLYPKPIADQILPLIIETMIEGGKAAPAAQLLAQRKDDRRLDYARALQQQAEGHTDQALALLNELAAGHDRFDRARAAMRAVELRLASHKIDASQAADALDKLVYVWRGDQRELALRERIAELRGQSGSWRVALSTLRQAESDFPDQAAAVHDRLKDAFAGMIAGHGLQQMASIDVVSAVDENADLMPANGGDPALEEQLADRLLALDLPERAKPVLGKLMTSTASAGGKARFGATLAALDLREMDTAGAITALDASEGPGLPPDLTEKRALLRAHAMASGGNLAAAAAALSAIGTPAANEARATILEQAQDWPAAEQAWSAYAATALPPDGALDDGQARTLLRLSTAAARASDDTALAALRQKYAGRIAKGALADMFHLLTAEPVRGVSDLERAKQEASLAQSLPANLNAIRGSAPAR